MIRRSHSGPAGMLRSVAVLVLAPGGRIFIDATRNAQRSKEPLMKRMRDKVAVIDGGMGAT